MNPLIIFLTLVALAAFMWGALSILVVSEMRQKGIPVQLHPGVIAIILLSLCWLVSISPTIVKLITG